MGNPYMDEVPESLPEPEKMDRSEANTVVEQLRDAINFHDRQYYQKNDPQISDRDYDRLFSSLESFEEEFPDLQSDNSPTRRVGAPPIDELETVEHPVPLLSLDSSLEEEDVRDFDRYLRDQLGHDDFSYLTECKFDGLSVRLTYEDGSFQQGATRGDGRRGEDVTRNLRTVRTLPLQLADAAPGRVVVRGEVFMRLDPFQELNQRRVSEGKEPFANPRNAAAGTLRQLDPEVTARRPLDLFVFELLETSGVTPEHQVAVRDQLRDWGFPIHDEVLQTPRIGEVIDFRHRMVEQRDQLPFEIDGTVIKVNEMDRRNELGERQSNPRWALAYKFPPRDEETVIQRIGIQVGRTGKLTPVAFLNPVDVGGVTVSRASLHNDEFVRDRDIREGDRVKVIRAGDVIPYVEKRLDDRPEEERGEPFQMPEECPVCGSAVRTEGAYHLCTGGLACSAQRQGLLEHFVSRDAMDIEGLGEEELAKLREQDLVETPADLYRLEEEDLLEAGLFKNETYLELRREADNPELAVAIFAQGLDELGPALAVRLANYFGDVVSLIEADETDIVDFFANEELEDFLERASNPDLAAALLAVDFPGIGPERILRLTETFQDGEALLGADEDDLAQVDGIGLKTAEAIRRELEDSNKPDRLRHYLDHPIDAREVLVSGKVDLLEQIDPDRLRAHVNNPDQARAEVGKAVHNVLAEIEASKETTLDRFLYALGIRHVGQHVARILAERYDSVEQLIETEAEQLQQIEDIGPKVAASIQEYFRNETNREIVRDLLELGVQPEPLEFNETDDEFAGETFVFTGSIPDMTRNEATEAIESRGGRVTSSVSGNTDYLVVGENPGQTKQQDAEEHGTRQLDPDEFLNLIR